MIEFDLKNPLTRCKGEPKTANAALGDYFRMGSGRSLRALFADYRGQIADKSLTKRPPTSRLATISTWSARFSWQERIACQEQIDRIQAELLKSNALAEQFNRWAERQITVRDRDWDQAEEIRKLVDQILVTAPNYLKRSQKTIKGKDGSPDTVIIREQLDLKLLIGGLQVASRLQRLAVEMETEHNLNENTTPENLEEIRKRRWDAIKEQLAELETEDEDETGEPKEE